MRTEESTRIAHHLTKIDSKEGHKLDIEVATAIVTIMTKACRVADNNHGRGVQVKNLIAANVTVDLIFPFVETSQHEVNVLGHSNQCAFQILYAKFQ